MHFLVQCVPSEYRPGAYAGDTQLYSCWLLNERDIYGLFPCFSVPTLSPETDGSW